MEQIDIFDFLDHQEENIDFSKQVAVFKNELNRVFDYVEYTEWRLAVSRMYEKNQIIDEDIKTFVMFASYVGTLLRINYYRYVYKRKFDVRALADAAVMSLMFGNAFRFEFEPYVRTKKIRDTINKTRYPKWTRIGLLGGSTKEIVDLGNEFSEYMDDLKG